MSESPHPDHDQRLKTLVMAFFREFLYCFFADWAARFDFDALDWLTQEVFPDPPQGERRLLDLVCRLRLLPGVEPPFAGSEDGGLIVVHVEIESQDRIASFRRRCFDYYVDLRRRYDLPVWPIGLFLRVGLEGIGWDAYVERFWDRNILEFQFAFIGLPALEAEAYVGGENLLGVALSSLMRVPRERRAELQAAGLDRIARSEQNKWRRFLLAETLQAYSELDAAEWERLQQLLLTEKYQEARPMTLTYYERGKIEGETKGRLEGELQGRLAMARKQLEKKFGPLSPAQQARLETRSPEQLEELCLDLLEATTLQELGFNDCDSAGSTN